MSVPDWPEIWFLRHGETEWNLAGRIQGRRDSPLTARGRAQARAQAQLIAPVAVQVANGPGSIFVSPLGRARQTAGRALPGHTPVIDPRLAEIDTGAWEGRLKSDLPHGANDLEIYAVAPGGEGLEALIARVSAFADGLRGPSIVVAHGLWGQVLRGLAQGLAPSQMGAQENAQGCIYHLAKGCERRIGTPGAH